MSRRIWLVWLTIVIFALVITACSSQDEEATPDVASATPAPTAMPTVAPPTATPLTEPVFNLAQVDSLEILIGEGDDDDVTVRLRGAVSNGCARVDDIITELENDVFTIAVLKVRDPAPPDQECVEEEIPFDETVDLIDVAPGSYIVMAHGLQGSFTIEAAVEEAAEDPPPATPAPVTAPVSGRVWHDFCLNSGAAAGELPDGCIDAGESGFRANGASDDEPGIAGVRVGIGAGSCDAPVTEFAITDAEGNYAFDDLPLGQYCITVDSSDPQNQELLLTGVWTSPQGGLAEQVITIADGSGEQAIDFGWDFEFLPLGEIDPETCENSLAYIEDINIPDDTEFAPGQSFTKRWLLGNNGTCPWSTEYGVVFVGGDQMSAPEILPLDQPVVPGQTTEVAIDMIAPTVPGTYRGNWQIADPSGEPFGIDGFIEDAFWLRIVVSADATPGVTPSADSGTIGGVVWEDFCLNSDPGSGCLEFPEGSGIYIANGTFDRLESALGEITISLAFQACPSDGSLPTGASVLSTTTTGDDGLYRFENLDSGMYCIFMDALSDENVNFLIPGNWTWPATGVGRYTFFLDPGEQALDLDFGWEFVD